jgi:methionyl-tRNA formyltransferase
MTHSNYRPSVVLMGSKPGSVVALEIMCARGWDVRYVVTPQSIGHPFIAGETLSQAAARLGVEVVSSRSLPTDLEVDLVISYMYRYLVKPRVLRMARLAALNFHAGPLPEYGGWAFYNVAILEDATEYGCTCHYMDEGFDTGPLLEVRRFPIDAQQETAWSLERRAQIAMIELFVDVCDQVESGSPLPREEQDPAHHRYLHREAFEALKQIPPDADAETIDRHARAFWYPPYGLATLALSETVQVEVIPEIAKDEIARRLHGDDLTGLRVAAERHVGRSD